MKKNSYKITDKLKGTWSTGISKPSINVDKFMFLGFYKFKLYII